MTMKRYEWQKRYERARRLYAKLIRSECLDCMHEGTPCWKCAGRISGLWNDPLADEGFQAELRQLGLGSKRKGN